MAQREERYTLWEDLWAFVRSKKMWINLGVMILISLIIVWMILFWLDNFTRHGQKLLIPDYTEKPIELAIEDAEDRSFEIVVSDSVFFVGEEGGIIKRQNPKSGSQAKQGRKIYVTITKYTPEIIKVSALPRLYGESYEIKSQELQMGYDLKTEIVDRVYDPGPEGHIMEVLHEGNSIINETGRSDNYSLNRGDRLSVITSKSTGGYIIIPDLICKTLQEARFQLSAIQLELGNIEVMGATDDIEQAYITDQSPSPADGENSIQMGEKIQVWVSPIQPRECSDLNSPEDSGDNDDE
jgi:beta-lactam-binding protein with PASTA domain